MEMSSPEEWVKKNYSIEQVLQHRGSMIYAKSFNHLKSLNNTMQELAIASKPVGDAGGVGSV